MRHFLHAIAGFGMLASTASAVAAQDSPLAADGPATFDAIPADAVSPFGGLSLTPTRVDLQPGSGVQTVTLFNSGQQTVTYRIDSVELEALEAGGDAPLEEGETPDWSASRYIRFAPRQVTLKGGERQVIKVISRAPRDLDAAEFRSHMRFSSIPTVAPVDEDETSDQTETSDSVEVSVGLEYRITIPVVLRTGQGEAGTNIRTAELVYDAESDQTKVEIELEKTGVWSNVGTVRVLDAAGEELALQRGVTIHTPLQSRRISLPLEAETAEPARVVFEAENEDGVILAQADLL